MNFKPGAASALPNGNRSGLAIPAAVAPGFSFFALPDAGCQQCPGRKISRRMRPSSTRLPQSPDKAQARPVSTVKRLHPAERFFSVVAARVAA